MSAIQRQVNRGLILGFVTPLFTDHRISLCRAVGIFGILLTLLAWIYIQILYLSQSVLIVSLGIMAFPLSQGRIFSDTKGPKCVENK